jgi:hydroxyethylthiazole kinase-like uncharacterized protein yjeF
MKILTAAEMREVDRLTTERFGVPGLTLMERAGASVAEYILKNFAQPQKENCRAVVLCGKGNNGGDGFVAARHLREAGLNVSAVLIGDPLELRGDAATNLQRWQQAGGALRVVRKPADWPPALEDVLTARIVVDALLGTGAHGAVTGLLAEVIDDVNHQRERSTAGAPPVVVAVDIPSGVTADSCHLLGPAIIADVTITFTAPKPGQITSAASPAAERCGRLIVKEIGSPRSLIAEIGKGDLRWLEPAEFASLPFRRRAANNKGNFGHVLVVAGSRGKSGAAVMASSAALRAGAGLVTAATPASIQPIVAAATPEIMTEALEETAAGTVAASAAKTASLEKLLEGMSVLAIGPGLSLNPQTQQFIHAAVAHSQIPVILDADGLNAFAGNAAQLAQRQAAPADALLAITPHPGEMARLAGVTTSEVQAHRVELARCIAKLTRSHVILKGYQTVIAAPDGRTSINSTGNPAMATGGAGDVLTGVLAGLASQFGVANWPLALEFGVYLHGLAADMVEEQNPGAPMAATDIIKFLAPAYASAVKEAERA